MTPKLWCYGIDLAQQLWCYRSPYAEDFSIDLDPKLWCYGTPYAEMQRILRLTWLYNSGVKDPRMHTGTGLSDVKDPFMQRILVLI